MPDWLNGVLNRMFAGDITPEPPQVTDTQPGQKRKASDALPQKSKARRLSQTRAVPQYTRPDYQKDDFYDGYPRRAIHRDSHPGSFDLGGRFVDMGTTFLEQPGTKGHGKRLSLPLTGVKANEIEEETQDIKEKIADLPVSDGKREEVRQKVAEEILESPKLPKSKRATTPPPTSTRTKEPMATPPGRRASSAEPSWTDAPNRRARKILEGYNGDKAQAAIAIRDSLRETDPAGKTEPLYALRDAEIRDGMWQLNDKLERFASEHYDFDFGSMGPGNKEVLEAAFASMTPETVTLIGCVASGGPSGAKGWKSLFHHKQKRRALVCAIIGNLLVEQVFEHIFFGGSSQDEEYLDKLQHDHSDEDGFDRNRRYALYVAEKLRRGPHALRYQGDYTLPEGFHAHIQAVVEAITVYLKDIDPLRPKNKRTLNDPKKRTEDLYKIVAQAGILSLIMRADPHTVYYFAPVFKEDDFKRKYMECFNEREMVANNPKERTHFDRTWTIAEKKRSLGDLPLNQITIMKGITTYRRGGWETGRSTPQKPEYAPGTHDKGIRTRILTHGWVYCRWGRPQKFEKGKPVDDKKVHGIQWEDPGFMKFSEVVEGAQVNRQGYVGKGKGKAE